MNPKPFASLNHFTVPVAIPTSLSLYDRRDDVRSTGTVVDGDPVAEKNVPVEGPRAGAALTSVNAGAQRLEETAFYAAFAAAARGASRGGSAASLRSRSARISAAVGSASAL